MPDMDKLVKIKFQGSRRELFRNPLDFPINDYDKLVVEAERGEDMGTAFNFPKPKTAGESEKELLKVLRKANLRDVTMNSENQLRRKTAFDFCLRKIDELQLPMKLTDVEYQLDRKKIIFFFTAEDRVDFRELVKILASEYKTRIEMRQISTREETRRVGGIGPCGKEICCHQFIDDFEPVSTQMVKEQNLPMNPSKISGLCGKLKCCFRYEHALYKEILEKYPAYGSKISFKKRTGTIEKIDIFSLSVTIKFNDSEIEDIPLKDFYNNYKVIE
ncbi:MAG: stage 0 sporulation protein [Candidatus Neomarinimicrobiota bacterium]|nr:MAG: stage 0 sporulation protein [Candidatus Neomarinimicrobiota bacterium]